MLVTLATTVSYRGVYVSRRRVQLNRKTTARVSTPASTDRFVGTVRDLSSDGRGVVEAPDGQIVFVSGAWVGEEVVVLRTRRGKEVKAELDDVVTASPHKQEAPCSAHRDGTCGGCAWMFIDYKAQLAQKHEKLNRSVSGLVTDDLDVPFLGSPAALGYRNRAQFKTDGEVMGYVAPGSHTIVDISSCPILTDENQRQLALLRSSLPNPQWRPGKDKRWTTIDIDDERLVPLVNQRQPFRQGNSEQNMIIINWLREKIDHLSKVEFVLELFCGSGNLTTAIASQTDATIVAVEGDTASLQALGDRELSQVQTLRVNLFSKAEIQNYLPNPPQKLGVVLDPPRDGLKERETLKPWFRRADWVLYIACDLATWERDSRFLLGCGLSLSEVCGLDMFPQTPHVEILSVFKRRP